MLKMTGVKLEKMSDIGMCLFFEKGLSSGFSCTAKRYAITNTSAIMILQSSHYRYRTLR